MNIKYSYSAHSDLKKLLFTCSQIKNNFYQSHGFLLFVEKLPLNIKSSKNVLLGKELFEYLTNDFDWKSFDAEKYGYIANENIEGHYDYLYRFLQDEVSVVDKNKIEEVTSVILDFYTMSDSKINIYWVSYGTPVSFQISEKNEITIYVRRGTSEINILASILGTILSKTTEYSQRALIQDHIFRSSKINKLIDTEKYDEIYNSIILDSQLTLESNARYGELGYPPKTDFTLLESGCVLSETIGEINFLTKSENTILKALVENKNKILGFDQIATLLWKGNDSKFSLEAISKTIERIRKKLHENGLRREFIYTKRGSGYILID